MRAVFGAHNGSTTRLIINVHHAEDIDVTIGGLAATTYTVKTYLGSGVAITLANAVAIGATLKAQFHLSDINAVNGPYTEPAAGAWGAAPFMGDIIDITISAASTVDYTGHADY